MPQRICRHCGVRLEEEQTTCPSCHTHNPIAKPWYVPLVGVAIVALLAWLLVDFGDVARVLGLD
jgi:hypothetical protein